MCHKRFIKSDLEKHNSKYHADNGNEEDSEKPVEEKNLNEKNADEKKSEDEREPESEGKLPKLNFTHWVFRRRIC